VGVIANTKHRIRPVAVQGKTKHPQEHEGHNQCIRWPSEGIRLNNHTLNLYIQREHPK
jgi:hypothetical protein